MDLHKFAPCKICRKFVKTEELIWGKDGKCLDIYTTLFFGIHINFLPLHFNKLATYLQGANLCKSDFQSSVLKTASRHFATPPS